MPEIRNWLEREVADATIPTRPVRKKKPSRKAPTEAAHERTKPRPSDRHRLAAVRDLSRRAVRFQSGVPCPSPRPDLKWLRHLAFVCLDRSDILDGRTPLGTADALVALSAHWRDWLRTPDDWEPPGSGPAG